MRLMDIPVNVGGLMRCCTDTILEMFEKDPTQELVEGERIDCVYENKPTMKVENGRIEWIGYEEATRNANYEKSNEAHQRASRSN